LIARRLEARFLGLDDLQREAASRYQVDAEQLRVFDTREPHFWDWLTTDTTRLLTYFHAVILKHLAEDQVVLVSHAMPMWVPKSVGHVLRVRTVAPIEVRVKRVMDEERLSAGQAEHRIVRTVFFQNERVAQDLPDCGRLDIGALGGQPLAAAHVPVVKQLAVGRMFHFLPLCPALAHRLSLAGTFVPRGGARAA